MSICQKSLTSAEPTSDPKPRDDKSSEQHRNVTSKEPPKSLNPATPLFKPTNSTTLWTFVDQTVLLQTAQAVAGSTEYTKRVHIVFDSGSQRSYITDQLRRELCLKKRGEQNMSIVTFGSHKECKQVCDVVHVAVEKSSGGINLVPLFTVPLICEPITCQTVAFCQASFSHLSSLLLADNSEEKDQLEVDILIGSDQYWNFVMGQIRRGDAGPIGIQTELGWVLSGPAKCESHNTTESALVVHTLRVDGNRAPSVKTLDDSLKLFWDLESLGITAKSKSTVLNEFHDKIHFVGDRY